MNNDTKNPTKPDITTITAINHFTDTTKILQNEPKLHKHI